VARGKRSCLFGPVASRRLGRSLGVDVLAPKTCTFDCVYCEVGRTTRKTAGRASFVPPDEILRELDEFFASGGKADYITFSGSGEPTLSSDLGLLIRESKKRFRVPVAVITNGALLWDPAVRAELAAADLVIPSLDSAREESFQAVNRPVPGITAARVIEGLRAFVREYKGHVWLEVLLTAGVNDSKDDVDALAAAIAEIAPERVQLNTVVRPPAEASARPVPRERLEEVARRFSKIAPTEIVAPASFGAAQKAAAASEAAVLETLRRRPCSAQDLAAGLSVTLEAVVPVLASLLERGSIHKVAFGKVEFYEAAGKD
jgi:wyosine [tRNA(Phe)-imidazoG37] synthetase (radical SAM superfamily)